MMSYHILEKDGVRAVVFNGQVVSLKFSGLEVMHIAQLPKELQNTDEQRHLEEILALGAWANSGIDMFPRIGVSEPGVSLGRRYALNNHGVSRHLGYRTLDAEKTFWNGVQEHDGKPFSAGGKDHLWPFRYSMDVRIELIPNGVRKKIILHGEKQEYQLGSHPAFRGTKDPKKGIISVTGRDFSLADLPSLLGTFDAYQVRGEDNYSFMNLEDGSAFKVVSQGYGNLAFWTPNGPKGPYTMMWCGEPETHLESKKALSDDCRRLVKPVEFVYEIVRI